MSTHRVQVPGSTSSAPNSPEMPRSQVSITIAFNFLHSAEKSCTLICTISVQIPRSKPHKHHRRNISSISAKEIAANLANGSRNNLQEREIFMKPDEDEDDYIVSAVIWNNMWSHTFDSELFCNCYFLLF